MDDEASLARISGGTLNPVGQLRVFVCRRSRRVYNVAVSRDWTVTQAQAATFVDCVLEECVGWFYHGDHVNNMNKEQYIVRIFRRSADDCVGDCVIKTMAFFMETNISSYFVQHW